MSNWIKAWISRDAMTRGIYEKQVVPMEGGFFNGCAMSGETHGCPSDYFDPGEWHLTREEAVKAAESMRETKIEALKRLTF